MTCGWYKVCKFDVMCGCDVLCVCDVLVVCFRRSLSVCLRRWWEAEAGATARAEVAAEARPHLLVDLHHSDCPCPEFLSPPYGGGGG